MSAFKDLFSDQSQAYNLARPHYPDALFKFLADLCKSHNLAWDCATGNGQAAIGLTPYFEKIIATDASTAQLQYAIPHSKIEYRTASAEHSGLSSHSIDLITVAQALHWFDLNKFYQEANRVLKKNGVLACFGYSLIRTDHIKLNQLIQNFYSEIVGKYWPEERKLVDQAYQTIPFPFKEIKHPKFTIEYIWDLRQLYLYLNTWSAVKLYEKTEKQNPIQKWLQPKITNIINEDTKLKISFPIFMRVGQIS